MTPAVTTTEPGRSMRREILEQPDRWEDLLRTQRGSLQEAATLLIRTAPELVVFAARGSSDHAAMFGQYLTHNLLTIPALLSTPSTVTAFGTTLRYPRSAVVAVSQSGESPDLLATVQAARDQGVPVIALTNDRGSSLAALATVHILLAAGPEVSVAATKTYTAEVLALHLLISLAAGISWEALTAQVEDAVAVARVVLTSSAPFVRDAAALLRTQDRVLAVGRGYSMSSAREGALKLMETNALAASGWSAADATHGPLGQVVPGTPVIALTASPGGRDSVQAFAGAAAALGGRIVKIGPADSDGTLRLDIDPGGRLAPELVPLVEIVPVQLLALELAVTRGLDPDEPAGLSKVTRTT